MKKWQFGDDETTRRSTLPKGGVDQATGGLVAPLYARDAQRCGWTQVEVPEPVRPEPVDPTKGREQWEGAYSDVCVALGSDRLLRTDELMVALDSVLDAATTIKATKDAVRLQSTVLACQYELVQRRGLPFEEWRWMPST